MTSEFVILIGVILVGTIFLTSFYLYTSYFSEESIKASIKSDAESLVGLIYRIFNEPSDYAYFCKKISLTNLTIEKGILTFQRGKYKFSFLLPKNVTDVRLEDTVKVCLVKSDQQLRITRELECVLDGICEPSECKIDCADCAGPNDICIGDDYCNPAIGENCENSRDCACEEGVCCPSSKDADFKGCSLIYERKKGEERWCDVQCGDGLECNPTASDFKDYEKACCEPGKVWNGNECIEEIPLICSPSFTSCYNNWHWKNRGDGFFMNVGCLCPCKENPPHTCLNNRMCKYQNCHVCDYFEVCHPFVKKIAEEAINCCNNECKGNCHTYCVKAVKDSGLLKTKTFETKKKCYGLYIIYGLGPAQRWLKGYQIHTEEPASIMLTKGTWMCTGYSIVLTTLLRSVGYGKEEVFSVCGPGHAYNLVKFPGEKKYRFVDTVGNSLYISGITSVDWYKRKYGFCRTSYECSGCMNDEGGHFSCPSPSNIYLGDSC